MATPKKAKRPKAPKKLRTKDPPEKASVQTRVGLSALVGQKASQSPIWQTVTAVSDSGTKLVNAGTALDSADKAATKADADALAAHTVRDAAQVEWDGAYAVYSSNVRQNAPTPADVAALALTVMVLTSHALAMPLGVDVKFDANLSQVDIHVKPAPGLKHVEIEISATPTDPNSWKRVKGNGLKRKVTGLAAGTWWVRACSVRAEDESDYTTPVAVVVK